MSPQAPAPWSVDPARVGLELWLVRRPDDARELAPFLALAPDRTWTEDPLEGARARVLEAPLASSLAAWLATDGLGGGPETCLVVASPGSIEEIVQHLLGIPPAGAAALQLEPGRGHFFRAEAAGWTLERSNVEDPRRGRVADLGPPGAANRE